MQIELLRELMKLQKDMIIMLLSMLEGKFLQNNVFLLIITLFILRKCFKWSK